jgi:DNA-binding transcriptional LysR family regulator
VQLFERSGRLPTLTPAGEALYREARAVVTQVGRFRARAGRLASGVEPQVDLAIDHRFPLAALMEAVDDLVGQYPSVTVTLRTVIGDAVADLVADGVSALGIAGALPPSAPPGLEQQPILTIPIDVLASPHHPLARLGGPPGLDDLGQHTQLVLIGRDAAPEEPGGAVPGGRVCQLTDPTTLQAFLRAGLGWGALPRDAVAEDLRLRRLVELRPAGWPGGHEAQLFVVHRRVDPPGLAARALIERLVELAGDEDYRTIDLSTRA